MSRFQNFHTGEKVMSKDLVVLFFGVFLLVAAIGVDAFANTCGGPTHCDGSGKQACGLRDLTNCTGGVCSSDESCKDCVCRLANNECGCHLPAPTN